MTINIFLNKKTKYITIATVSPYATQWICIRSCVRSCLTTIIIIKIIKHENQYNFPASVRSIDQFGTKSRFNDFPRAQSPTKQWSQSVASYEHFHRRGHLRPARSNWGNHVPSTHRPQDCASWSPNHTNEKTHTWEKTNRRWGNHIYGWTSLYSLRWVPSLTSRCIRRLRIHPQPEEAQTQNTLWSHTLWRYNHDEIGLQKVAFWVWRLSFFSLILRGDWNDSRRIDGSTIATNGNGNNNE